MSTIERQLVGGILERLRRPPPLIQVLTGARQVGKTTVAHQVAEQWSGPVRYAAADLALPPGPEWIETWWHLARRDANTEQGQALLILDEAQKVTRWSEVVKALWDEDRRVGTSLAVLLLGSSALLLAEGTTESLAGRFFLHRAPHWSWPETREAFGFNLEQWLYFGGYPGAAPLADDEPAWRSYVQDSLVETVITRDVLALHTVRKPALLRNLFLLAARFRGEILSYNKMLGQLADAGNTVTLAHYLELLGTAFLVSGLQRFSSGKSRSRGSSPKLVLWNNALATALGLADFERVRGDSALWGRLVDNAVGAHLLNHLGGPVHEITYWRKGNSEVDYVIESGDELWALEVKSGRPRRVAGLEAFRQAHPRAKALVIGTGGMPLSEFFEADPRDVLG